MLQPGEVVAGRFAVEALAGAGGMGDVFRARDLDTGEPVALKVLRAPAGARERFEREVAVLAGLRHPGVVRYVAHGATPGGARWLAMEWLEGEALDRRLGRRGLTTGESVALVRRLAGALAAAHARGVVHRDVKPSNVILTGGDPALSKLLDFGIARTDAATRALTRTGAVLGTTGYMAPEQASGHATDARADVFALGCVLFECLTGAPAYTGDGPLAVLAKLLLQEPPRARDARASVPPELDALCARMMASDPDARPPDAAAVLRELERLETPRSASVPAPAPSRQGSLTHAEQRVHTVVVAVLDEVAPEDDATVTPEQAQDLFAPLQDVAARAGGRLALLGPAAVALAIEGGPSATDGAAAAAAAALAIVGARRDARVAIATGRGESTSRGVMGAAIDRATRLFAAAGGRDAAPRGVVLVDDVTRGLLDARFDVRLEDGVHRLVLAERAPDAPRARLLLLGRPAPFVGRERELSLLEAAVAESAAEGVMRTVIVTAPPGAGKTRLLAELVERLRDRPDPPRLLFARGDGMRVDSSLALARQLVVAAAGAAGGDLGGAPERLAAYLAALPGMPPAARETMTELCGAVREGEASPALRAARNDPVAMRSALRRAFEAWIAAECARGPAVLALDDLHWADPASVSLLVSAARRAAERPLAILAFARPELADAHPQLAQETGAQELRLGALTRRAAERLVRAALGDAVGAAVVARVVDLAGGNAFFLEEMIRRVAERPEGGAPPLSELPDSVLAMAQARLARLDEEARRVLRAASVFGERFTARGVAAVLGDDAADEVVATWLPRLCADEVLAPEDDAQAASGGAYTFRHALLASAAHAMLTPRDLPVAHAAAAAFLVASGERDAALVAEHLLAAEQPRSAVPWITRAARAALDGGNLTVTFRLVDRAFACGAEGEDRGHLFAYVAHARGLQGDWKGAGEAAGEAIGLLPRGTTAWFRAATTLVFGEVTQGQVGATLAILRDVLSLDVTPEPTGPFGRTVTVLLSALALFGQTDFIEGLLRHLDDASGPGEEASFTLWRHTAHALADVVVRADLGAALRAAGAACALLDGVDDPMAIVLARSNAARVLADAGRCDEALAHLDEAVAVAERFATTYLRDWALLLRGGVLVYAGRTEGVREALEPLLAHKNAALAALARLTLGNDALARGDLDAAERDALLSASALGLPMITTLSCSIRARSALARGRPAAALDLADQGLALRTTAGGLLTDTSGLLLARVEALDALGRHDETRAALAEAVARLDAIAATIDAPEARESYLAAVRVNARTLALARRVR